jgi:hypothetical protein
MIKKLILAAGVTAPLAFTGVGFAATTPSDYAQDVQAGQNQIHEDADAKSHANEVKEGEIVEGQVDDGDVEVNETVGEQENGAGDSQHGGSSHEGASESSGSSNGGHSPNGGGGNE